MHFFKTMILAGVSLFLICFAPEAEARGQRCKVVKVKKHSRSSSFNVNLNVDSSPNYVAYNTYNPPVYPAPCYQSVTTTYGPPCAPATVVQQRVYYPYYPQPVVVEQRPAVGFYFQPSFSYWRY